jgi:hypothetical protein
MIKCNMNKEHYVYAYLREDGTPYYIGKGKGRRAWHPGHNVSVPNDDSRIMMIETNLSDEESMKLEIDLISKYGRKDLGTGILRNLTNGGDGPSGRIASKETCKRISTAKAGKPSSMKGKKNPGLSKALKGKKQSPEHIEKAAATRRGKPNPKVSIALKGRSAKNKGTTQEKICCPHCNKIGGISSMLRWHFDNCKHKNKERNE